MPLDLSSRAFASHEWIPVRYTRDGDNVSPPLEWHGVPPGTRELALIVDDPDAPADEPFVHWVAFGIAPSAGSLPEAISPEARPSLPAVRAQGRNSFARVGYDGPAPPEGHGAHHYHFHLYALDRPVAATGKLDKKRLIAAMSGHIIAEADLVGLYQRPL